MDGDCPSFVTVELPDPAKANKRDKIKRDKIKRAEPPVLPDLVESAPVTTQNVFLAGIGGTGIVTVNQVLATAALRAGYEVASLDQIGLSQKAGPVVSHLRFALGELEPANRLTPGSADCIVAFDLLAATDNKNLAYGSNAGTLSVASTSKTPTGDMVYDKSVSYPDEGALLSRLERVSRSVRSFDALAAAEVLFGNTAAANFLMVGAAYQIGGLRLPAAAIEEAIEINGVAVAVNIAAFRWGRVAVAHPDDFAAATTRQRPKRAEIAIPTDLFDGVTATGETRRLIELRAVELIGFQGIRVARAYVRTVQHIWDAEQRVTDRTEFSEQVARGLYKFTAYKDEYEVARRLIDPAFLDDLADQLPEGANLTYRLHPPVLRAMGRKKKIGLGPRSHLALRVLAEGKRLRGTKFDPFGYAHVRRVERALLAHYTEMVTALAAELDVAVKVAALTDIVRGYEEIKLANVELYQNGLRELGIEPPQL
jgi:indolepyruvate ferredoxin oxidoreductase